jgi:hypothetical protein
MKILIEKVTGDIHMRTVCEFTSGKQSKISLKRMYQCEHSPIRTQIFFVRMYNIPSFVSVHFVRHKIGVDHFVKSNRSDSTGISDEQINRLTPVDHLMIVNAQSLINIARKRLCYKAHEETVKVMEAIKEEMFKIDKDLYPFLVPECSYRGGICHELQPCGKRRVKIVNK